MRQRQRSLSARYEKARRGDLVVTAPVGFVKAGDRYEKDPDRRVQEAIKLVFDKVEEVGSARANQDGHRPGGRRAAAA
ncbi:DNA invertase Pin-like site-specific DNA recombinase [Bradyrhizobium sp. USDA 4503]